MSGISILFLLRLTLLTEAGVNEKTWLAHALTEVQAVSALSLEVFVLRKGNMNFERPGIGF